LPHTPIPKIPERKYFYSAKVAADNNEGYEQPDFLQATFPENANLVSSLAVENGLNVGHAPVIDFDVPIEVLPSTQLGHYHLYIHHTMNWVVYKKILEALAESGAVEPGFVQASKVKGFTAVRPVGVVKPNPPRGSAVLIENAQLRHENFILKQRISELEAQVNNEPKPSPTNQAAAKATVKAQKPAFV
jgi:hypothetical protein